MSYYFVDAKSLFQIVFQPGYRKSSSCQCNSFKHCRSRIKHPSMNELFSELFTAINSLRLSLLFALAFCGCVSNQNVAILSRTTALKAQTLALMDKAVEPYSSHSQEIDNQSAQLEQIYDQERARPGNEPTQKMWATLLHVDSSLPGSGIYARFLQQWKKKSVLSPSYIADKKENVGDAFDKIINLESAKPQS
jgi:hypothetical protein